MASEPAAPVATPVRLTLVQNITFRLIGLFIFLAPHHGAEFMASVVVGTNRSIAESERKRKETSLASRR